MLPLFHLLGSLAVIAILFPFYNIWSFVFLVGSFFIDIDHYIWYVIKERDFSLRRAYLYSRDKRNKGKDHLHIFHVWEFWVLLFLLAFFNTFFALVFLGLVFHLTMDFIDLYFHMDCIRNRAFSFFMWLKRHQRLEKKIVVM